jgi:hypothetical protein
MRSTSLVQNGATSSASRRIRRAGGTWTATCHASGQASAKAIPVAAAAIHRLWPNAAR